MSTLRQQLVELQATEDASVARLRELDREYKKVCGEVNALRVSMDHQCAETGHISFNTSYYHTISTHPISSLTNQLTGIISNTNAPKQIRPNEATMNWRVSWRNRGKMLTTWKNKFLIWKALWLSPKTQQRPCKANWRKKKIWSRHYVVMWQVGTHLIHPYIVYSPTQPTNVLKQHSLVTHSQLCAVTYQTWPPPKTTWKVHWWRRRVGKKKTRHGWRNWTVPWPTSPRTISQHRYDWTISSTLLLGITKYLLYFDVPHFEISL